MSETAEIHSKLFRAAPASIKAAGRLPTSQATPNHPEFIPKPAGENCFAMEAIRRQCIRSRCQSLSIIAGMEAECLVNFALCVPRFRGPGQRSDFSQ